MVAKIEVKAGCSVRVMGLPWRLLEIVFVGVVIYKCSGCKKEVFILLVRVFSGKLAASEGIGAVKKRCKIGWYNEEKLGVMY